MPPAGDGSHVWPSSEVTAPVPVGPMNGTKVRPAAWPISRARVQPSGAPVSVHAPSVPRRQPRAGPPKSSFDSEAAPMATSEPSSVAARPSTQPYRSETGLAAQVRPSADSQTAGR